MNDTPPTLNDLPRREPGASGYEKFLTGNVFFPVPEPVGGWPEPSEALYERLRTGLLRLP